MKRPSMNPKFISPKKINRVKRIEAKAAYKNRVRDAKASMKVNRMQNSAKVRQARNQANITRGGFIGSRARKRELKAAKFDADKRILAMEPKLQKEERLETMRTDADVKKMKAKYAGYAGVATALGSSYYGGKKSDEKMSVEKTKQTAIEAQALLDQLNSIPDAKTGSTPSVSGLITGVR